jgi:hypothetical protein
MDTVENNHVIESLGGNTSVARLCGISSQAVSGWRKNGIPKSRMLYFRLLRPDLFPAPERPKEEVAE